METEQRQKKERSVWRKLAKSYDDNTLTAYMEDLCPAPPNH